MMALTVAMLSSVLSYMLEMIPLHAAYNWLKYKTKSYFWHVENLTLVFLKKHDDINKPGNKNKVMW